MYRLTREVRLNVPVDGIPAVGGNGHAGTPAPDTAALHWSVRVTLAGTPLARSGYLIDIKAVDDTVRRRAGVVFTEPGLLGRPMPFVVRRLFDALRDAWPTHRLERIALATNPYQSFVISVEESSMIQFNQCFEFSAAHRLHNADLSDDENLALFGKCNNPAGHGHNYEVEVSVRGTPDADGRLIAVAELERLVDAHAIRKVDHKHLNVQVTEFADLNPSVENIARVIYGWLKPHLKTPTTTLRAVTVWETPKTSCQYSETEGEAALTLGTV